jgi:hypothetical protein
MITKQTLLFHVEREVLGKSVDIFIRKTHSLVEILRPTFTFTKYYKFTSLMKTLLFKWWTRLRVRRRYRADIHYDSRYPRHCFLETR